MPNALDHHVVYDPDGGTTRLGQLWERRTAVLLFVRHFGCLFCEQQIAALLPALPRIRGAGAELFVIGNGDVEQARAFRATHDLPVPLYTDPTREVYCAAGLRRGAATVLHPMTYLQSVRALMAGFRQRRTAGDPLQQGGVLIIEPGGTERYRHVSRWAGDHPSTAAIVRHCERGARGAAGRQ